MSDSLLVLVDDEVAGVLQRLPGGRLRFHYERAYQEDPDPTPLSLSMPIQVASHSDRVVSPWLWGLLPDNPDVLRRWAREFEVRPGSAFALLATPIGEDCPGAVRFVPPEGLEAMRERRGKVAWLDEEAVARRLRELREDSTAWLGESFTGQFSLAGAQAKTALLREDGRWGQPSGPIPTTHILKPGVSRLDEHDLDEHLCLDAARRAGLVAARTEISRFAGESAVVVSRYDRIIGETGIRRVHQEDLCQALSVAPERKYENDGGPGAARIVRLLRESMPATIAAESVARFADALIWNWLIGGTDAHAKNYSLLLAGEQVRLAPLYDVASALPYATDERSLRLAMKIGGRYDVHPRRNPWPRTAADLGLDGGELTGRAIELAHEAPGAFAAAAAAESVVALESELPGRLGDLIAARAERCLTVLESPGPRPAA
jgi:serine/threonine-protein kinase HipA